MLQQNEIIWEITVILKILIGIYMESNYRENIGTIIFQPRILFKNYIIG